MKFLSLILLVSGTCTFAMELDQASIQEFLINKKTMVAVSKGLVDENNLLLKRFSGLSKLNEVAITQEYANPSLYAEATFLHDWLSKKPEYQSALATAKAANTNEAWDTFRKGNGPLIHQYFEQNGIKTITSSCADFFNANSHLNAEQVEKVVAQSFVIYYIRQLQRNQSLVMPSAINIT